MKNSSTNTENATNAVITSENLLNDWQGHRRLTRRVIEAFPEKDFFEFSIGGMRPFASLVLEMIDMAAPGMNGIVSNEWQPLQDMMHISGGPAPKTKAEYLQIWDEITEKINTMWPLIPEGRFQEMTLAFGQYEGQVYSILLYFIDNEIHHRGQAYVYLRALGIEPPPFWDRN